jgi:hypothetical protein
VHYFSQWGGWICLWINRIFHCNNSIGTQHNAEPFNIKKLKFCGKEGVLGYTTVNYKFKPLDDILAGKNVVLAEPDSETEYLLRIQYR